MTGPALSPVSLTVDLKWEVLHSRCLLVFAFPFDLSIDLAISKQKGAQVSCRSGLPVSRGHRHPYSTVAQGSRDAVMRMDERRTIYRCGVGVKDVVGSEMRT